MDERLVEQMRALYENSSNFAGMAAFIEMLHPDVVLRNSPQWIDQAEHHGPPGVEEWFAQLEAAFGRFRFELIDLTEVGDMLLAEVVIHVEGKTSGAQAAKPFFHLIGFRDGRIDRLEGYNERDEAEAAAKC